MPDPPHLPPATGQPPSSAPPAPFLRPRRSSWVGYLAFVALLFVAFIALTQALPRLIDRYQMSRPRYAAERALEDLKRGDAAAARGEVEANLAADRPYHMRGIFHQQANESWEGRVLRERTLIYERLAAELFDAHEFAAAEDALWKSMLEGHDGGHAVELIAPWELVYWLELARATERGPAAWGAAFEAARILSALGAASIRTPDRIRPMSYKIDPTTYLNNMKTVSVTLAEALKDESAAESPQELRDAARALSAAATQTTNVTMRRLILARQYRCLIGVGDAIQAREVFRQAWGRESGAASSLWETANAAPMELSSVDPAALDWIWESRPANVADLESFLGKFSADARLQLCDFSAMKTVDSGYFNLASKVEIGKTGTALFQSNGVGALDIDFQNPVQRIFIACQTTPVLGFYPILLVSIDGAPYAPLYCDAAQPKLAALDCTLAAGRHHLEFVFLNDAAFNTANAVVPSMREKKIEENREVRLLRLALVQGTSPAAGTPNANGK